MFSVGDKVKIVNSSVNRDIVGKVATVKIVYDDRHYGISIGNWQKGHRLGGLLDDLSGRDMAASNLEKLYVTDI